MKRVLAVSGGIDSMTLLDLMAERFPAEELVVATFDHGTRESSAKDAEFVSEVASALKLKVYRGKAELGAGVSEEKARAERYRFLREVAFLEKGEIWTAHHLDDLVETVAINLVRGTGIRGLAPFSSPGIRRPFIEGEFGEVFDKAKVLTRAAERGVRFREDPTNASEDYLRNRVRKRTREMSREEKLRLFELFLRQKAVVKEIDEIIEAILPEDLRFFRGDFSEMDEKVALEILRGGLGRAGVSATRPQVRGFLTAIREYAPGKKFNLPNDHLVKMNKHDFQIRV
ncbi:tRNA lysidine(34) synthetase TilS [Candidatus Saccharibacteria bacterium]|nr:tRNA lysidine(34) synthetase TilS [Candidatus Saccharibacteria bacterium]